MRPPLSDKVVPGGRICSRDLNFPHGVPCGKTPFLHVCWQMDNAGADCGFVCDQHTRELTERGWDGIQAHEIGPDCQMPGALWDFDANRCYVPDTTTDTQVTEKEAVPA